MPCGTPCVRVLVLDSCVHCAHSLTAKNQSQDTVIATYKRLIRAMPRANQYLLLYVLDLLSVFARKADKNLMTATSACLHRPTFFLIAHFTFTLRFFFPFTLQRL